MKAIMDVLIIFIIIIYIFTKARVTGLTDRRLKEPQKVEGRKTGDQIGG